MRDTYCCACLYAVLDRSGRQPPVSVTWTPEEGGPQQSERLDPNMRSLEMALSRPGVSFEIRGFGMVSILAETFVDGSALCIEHGLVCMDTLFRSRPFPGKRP